MLSNSYNPLALGRFTCLTHILACFILALPVDTRGDASKGVLPHLFFAASVPLAQVAQRPNILILMAEDLSPDLACYGEPLVHSPNIDGLAKKGIRYDNVFATASVCSPARSGILTGIYQTRIDSHQHRNFNPQPLPADIRVLHEIFKEAGYFVFNGDADDLSQAGKVDANFVMDENSFDGTDWRQRREGQPFFGFIQFDETHRDFARDPYNPINPDDVVLPPYYPDHPLARRDWADYLEDIQILDRKVGAILERLQADGEADTLIIFVGDHGRPMLRDKQFLYDPGLHVPLIASWPGHLEKGKVDDRLISLIDLIPSCLQIAGLDVPGNIDGKPLLFKDIPGRDYVFATRDRTGEAADRIRMIRSKEFKLIRNFHPVRPYTTFSAYKEIQYPVLHLMRMLHHRNELTPAQALFFAKTRPFEELYQISVDMHEINNLADDEDFSTIRYELTTKLDEWLAINDSGIIPEDYTIEVDWYLRNQRWYQQTLEERGMVGDDTPERHVEYWTERLMR